MIRPALGLLVVSLLAVPAGAQQDDPFETHLYNVEFLTERVEDHPGQKLGLAQDAIGTAVTAGSELVSGLLSGGDLIKLIKTNVAEDTWDHVSAHITVSAAPQ